MRRVGILEPNPGAANNTITTSLYTWYTFPTVGVLELLYPWKKFANFYFFLVGLMQMTPASLTGGQPSTWATLTFIMVCELFFKAREDLQRHRADLHSQEGLRRGHVWRCHRRGYVHSGCHERNLLLQLCG